MSRGMGRSLGGKKSAATRKMVSAISGVNSKAPKVQSPSNYVRKAKRSLW